MARSFDIEPYSELEVAPVESTSDPQPQPLHDHYRNQAERDAAEKQAVEFDHESPILVPIPRKPVPPKETIPFATKEATPVTSPIVREESLGTPSHTEDKKRKRKRTRWIVIGVIVLVVVAAVAGGVAGGLVGKHSSDKSTPSPAAATSTTPSATPSLPPPSSTSTATVTPTMSGPAIALASYVFPTAISWGAPHLEVFALNQGSYPEWKYRLANSIGSSENNNWQPSNDTSPAFSTLGGRTAPDELSIAAVARSTTDVAIYVAGTDLSLYSQWHNASMVFSPGDGGWQSLGGVIISPPTAVSWAPDRVDVFAIGTDYGLWQLWWTADVGWHYWYGFQSQFSFTTYAPTVVSWAENRYDIFEVGSEDQALYHRYFDGASWEPSADFEKLGGFCTSRPVAVTRSEGYIDVFVRGGDAGLWHISFTQGRPTPEQWSSWTQISGDNTVQAEPEAVIWDANNIHIYAWGSDNTLLHRAYNSLNDSWTPQKGFTVLGEGLSGPPKAVNDGTDMHVFAYLNDGQLGHKSWNADSNVWNPQDGFESMGIV